MGTIVALYTEVQKRFIRLGGKFELSPEGVRHALSTRMRYCLGGNVLYVPASNSDDVLKLRLAWARISPEIEIDPVYWTDPIGEPIELSKLDPRDVRVGNRYTKRQLEDGGKFVAVSSSDFEGLCAELFVRRGFKVDLFRKSKDGSIDFLAIEDENIDPVIFAVQCKQPEFRDGKRRKSVGRPVLQQVYGAAKAWDMKGGIVVSGSTYSADAKKFSKYKEEEMLLYDQQDILDWIENYRWNEDELK